MTQRPAINGGRSAAHGNGAGESLAGSLLSVPIRRQAHTPDQTHTNALAGIDSIPARAQPATIIDYWRHCCSGAAMPACGDIDRDTVARHWPDSLLVANRNGRYQFEERLGTTATAEDAEIATMAVEWILTLCEETARRRTPLEKSDLFPTSHGDIRLHAIALPLADDGVTVDHILCHLRRAG